MPLPPCPKCSSEFVYQDQSLLICPECAHEWNPSEPDDEVFIVKDSNGTPLNEGDKIIAEGLTKVRPGMKVKPIIK